ncbi:kinase-like domain-containing protein, partial [Talaromyces proteolyticus]
MSSSQHDDLFDLFKLDAVVTDNYTTHVEYRNDRVRGIRKEKIENRWYRERDIGEGAFGKVWLEVRRDTNDKRAVKRVSKLLMLDYKKELLALAKFSKDKYQQEGTFVKFFGWFEDSLNIFLAMEFLELGDLEQYITATASISEDEVKEITIDVLNGLQIMHYEKFAHRDLKPSNIFVVQKPPESRWWVKIGDFGISKRAEHGITSLHTVIGTPHYMAPEITGDLDIDEPTSVYDTAVDMWSLGCVIYKIATQRVPFSTFKDMKKFYYGKTPFPEQLLLEKAACSVDGVRFIKKLILPNPKDRLSAPSALEQPWLS